ncbi:MAG: S49 family peptidase [Propioniciclava sp.]
MTEHTPSAHPDPETSPPAEPVEPAGAVPAEEPAGAAAVAVDTQPPPPPHPSGPVPPRRERPFARGFGLGSGVGLGFGLAVIVVSLISAVTSGLVFMGFAAGAALAGPGQMAVEPLTTVWGSPDATQKLRAIPVQGVIMATEADGLALTGGTYGYEVADVLDAVTAEDASGVVLLLNTPGGSISGSRAIADAIDRYRERTGHQVYAYVESMSASGGMYAMAGADEIIADHGSQIGSVGVITGPVSQYTDVVAVDGGLLGTGVTTTGGVDQEYFTAGRGKDVGNPFRPVTEEEREVIQEALDDEYATFVSQVATKRGIDESVMTDDVGAALLGTRRAQEVGYIDDVLGRDDAFRHFAEASGLDPEDTRIEQTLAPSSVWGLLGVEQRPWGVALAAQPTEGQPARATSTLCVGAPVPVAWHGPVAGYCG